MGRATALAFAREGASVVGCDLAVEAAAAISYFNRLEAVTDEEWDRARWGEVDPVLYVTGVDIVVDGGMKVW